MEAARINRTQHELKALGIVSAAWTVVALVVTLAMYGGVRLSFWVTPRPLPNFHPRLAELPAMAPIAQAVALRGREVFEQTCSVCHSSTGLGKPGLGKSLVHSDFVADMADGTLAAFIAAGRAIDDPRNTSKVAMPPKGGNAALTDADLGAVVQYVRGMQDPRRMPTLPAYVPPPVVVTAADTNAALIAAGGDKELAGYIAHGTALFNSICIACHGPGGTGIKGNGKTLAKNEFIGSLSDDALLEFIKKGRDPGDPKNTTGIGMPSKGGNPALSEDDILDVISYLRTLQGPPKAPQPKP